MLQQKNMCTFSYFEYHTSLTASGRKYLTENQKGLAKIYLKEYE